MLKQVNIAICLQKVLLKEAIKTPAGTLKDPKTGDIKGGVKSGPSIPYSPPFGIGPSDASGPRHLR